MVKMVTPRNDTIELSVVKEKQYLHQQRPLPSAPPAEYRNGNTLELGKRSPAKRKRCWPLVTLVGVILVVIGAGTIVFYDHLTGRLPTAESSNGFGPVPEVEDVDSEEVVAPPVLSDPYPEESIPVRLSTTEVIFIDSTTTGEDEDDGDEGMIFIDSKEESVESNSEDRSSTDEDRHEEIAGSGDDASDHRESSEETSYYDGSSGSGSGDDSEG